MLQERVYSLCSCEDDDGRHQSFVQEDNGRGRRDRVGHDCSLHFENSRGFLRCLAVADVAVDSHLMSRRTLPWAKYLSGPACLMDNYSLRFSARICLLRTSKYERVMSIICSSN